MSGRTRSAITLPKTDLSRSRVPPHPSPLTLLFDSRFQLRNPRLHLLQLLASMAEHFLLHIEFFARHQIEPRESARQPRAQILLDVFCRGSVDFFAPHAIHENQ